MRLISAKDDGTTVIEMTDNEAHAIRDVLALAAKSSSDPAWALYRLLAHTHGDAEQ
jgi:hypothetical protein